MNIVIVGVGGQGTLLASRILGQVALSKGLDVKLSEVHGMSQRGGSVITHVRMGEKVYTPMVTPGEADYVLAFELLEALRALPFLAPGGRMIVNTQKIKPMPVITGAAEYPENIEAKLGDALQLDALSLALEAGSARAVNIVLLGALSALVGDDEALWRQAIEACVPPKTLETNIKAFEAGRKAARR